MDHFVTPEVREECLRHSVRIDPNVAAGIDAPGQIGIESPANVHQGQYEIDLIGAFSYIGGGNTSFRHVGLIGRFCAIARNIQAGHIEHPTRFLSPHPILQGTPGSTLFAPDFVARNMPMIEKSRRVAREEQEGRFGKIIVGNDVWIGEGAFIRRGVEIGDGAIIGARSVVMRDVPPYAIVAGAPARVIRYRFEPEIIAELLQLQWWRYGVSALEGADFTDIDLALWRIGENISSGRAIPYQAPILNVRPDGLDVLHYDPDEGTFTNRAP
jgi:acetyltransferase-like isoleucine patch superfamily enzyme